MGAEIVAVDIPTLTAAQIEEIRQALFRHKMIYFRNQKLSHTEHERFSLQFGELAEDAYTQGIAGHRNVHPLIKEADDQSKMVFGEGWHTDSPFLPKPPAMTMLYSVVIPPYGGDTMWANSALAYTMLSDTYRHMIEGLKVHFSLRDVLKAAQEAVETRDRPIGRLAATRESQSLSDDLLRKIRGSVHPLVRSHPAYNDYQGHRRELYRTTVAGEVPA